MERIREALERARQERQGATASPNRPGPPKPTAPPVPTDEPIAYTQTRTVKISKDFLREKKIISGFNHGVYVDAFKILSTQVLQRMRDKGWGVLAVTSAGGEEGKTLTAINLAISIASEVSHTVLLVDADLRAPKVHQYFGLKNGPGLGDYLTGDVPVEQLLVHPDIGKVVILPGGKRLQNSSEMLASPRMAQLVQELKTRYPARIVLFDLPPILSAADVLAFSPYVDAALLVVEDGKTTQEEAQRATALLSSTHLLGTVLNKSTEQGGRPAG